MLAHEAQQIRRRLVHVSMAIIQLIRSYPSCNWTNSYHDGVGSFKVNLSLRSFNVSVLKVNRLDMRCLWYISLVECQVGCETSKEDPGDNNDDHQAFDNGSLCLWCKNYLDNR